MCTSIELKADLMGSVAVELSHGSVTHHRTLGSHDSLIIRGIVWSLSIIKTNHRPAACRLPIIACLWILCPHLSVTQSLCLFVHLSDLSSPFVFLFDLSALFLTF